MKGRNRKTSRMEKVNIYGDDRFVKYKEYLFYLKADCKFIRFIK